MIIKIFFNFPKFCPSCNSELYFFQDNAFIKCTNRYSCLSQKVERIKYFVSKKAMNINGLGEANILFLINNNIIQNFTDIYNIKDKINTRDTYCLASHDGWGEKSVNNLLNQIDESKTSL